MLGAHFSAQHFDWTWWTSARFSLSSLGLSASIGTGIGKSGFAALAPHSSRWGKGSGRRYDVMKYIVQPATLDKKCSYVQLVAPEGTTAQTPKWFVSHWSAGALFANNLDTHTRGRSFKSSVLLWSVRRVFCLFPVTQVRHFNGTSSRR